MWWHTCQSNCRLTCRSGRQTGWTRCSARQLVPDLQQVGLVTGGTSLPLQLARQQASRHRKQLQARLKCLLVLSADEAVRGAAGIAQEKAAEVAGVASDTVQGGFDAASQRVKVGEATISSVLLDIDLYFAVGYCQTSHAGA
jgi:hypothetical protein